MSSKLSPEEQDLAKWLQSWFRENAYVFNSDDFVNFGIDDQIDLNELSAALLEKMKGA